MLCLSVFFLSVTSQFYRTASARTRLTQPDPQVVDASLLTALCYKVTRVSASSDGSSRMPQLVCCLGLIAVTTPCHYCATFVGCQWYSELSSKLLSSFGSVSMALLQSTCKSYALKWTADSIRGRPRLRSASTGGIQLPRVQTSVAQRSFASYNGPAVWNSLPATLRDSSVSLHAFKRRLKTYLFAAR